MQRDVELNVSTDSIRLFGVTYSLQLFRVLAKRLAPGTHVEVHARDGGGAALHHFVPKGHAKP